MVRCATAYGTLTCCGTLVQTCLSFRRVTASARHRIFGDRPNRTLTAYPARSELPGSAKPSRTAARKPRPNVLTSGNLPDVAVEDALAAVAADWDDIFPTLSIRELLLIANPPRSLAGDMPEFVFNVLAQHLDPKHRAWALLQKGGADDRRSSSEAMVRIVSSAQAALSDPDIEGEVATDALLEVAARGMASQGYAAFGLDAELPPGVVAIELNGRRVAPAFQFETLDDYVLHPTFARASERLDSERDPLGTLSWWMSPNSWLGTTPAALLGTNRQDEIDYAIDQLANDSW